MSEMNVIILNDFNYVQGGASKVAIDTAELLAQNGVNTILFSATGTTDISKKYVDYCLGLPECLKDKNKIRGIINSCWNFKARKELKKILKDYDKNNTIIHVHGWTKSLSSSVVSLCFKLGYKVVLTQHDYFTICPNGGCFNYKKSKICKLSPFSISCVFCNCDSRNYFFKIFRVLRFFVQDRICSFKKNLKYFICISDFSFNKVRNYFSNVKIYEKINNPIDVFKTERVKSEENETYFFVGRVTKEKGIDLFCEAISQLNLKAAVLGDGDELDRLRETYPSINFLGWQNHNDMNKYLKNARVLVFPSLWYEGAPLTILENMSKGIPCVVADTCAGIEFVTDNYDGLFFKGGSIESLKEKMIQCDDNKVIFNMSCNCYNKYWDSPYSSKKYIQLILNFYGKVLEDF